MSARWVLLAGVLALDVPAAGHPLPVESFRVEAEAAPVAERPWWETFGDASLAELIVQGLAGNNDLGAASSRAESARARADQALAPLFPALNLTATGSASPSSSLGFQTGGLPTVPGAPTLPEVVYSGSAYASMRYSVDLFGRQLLAYQASLHGARASEQDRDGLGLSSLIAQAYFDAVAAAQQVAVIERQIEIARSLAEMTQLRYERGGTSGADVLQQRQQLAATRARLPPARSQLHLARQRLGVLLGRPPDQALPQVPARLPAPPAPPGLGMPAALLENRPDLRGALARLEASRSLTLSTQRALLPAWGCPPRRATRASRPPTCAPSPSGAWGWTSPSTCSGAGPTSRPSGRRARTTPGRRR